jgi:tetrahydromethanopterin:alpha-L-glutamate ligase
MTLTERPDVWILDRLQPDWEDRVLAEALRDRGLDTDIVDWAELRPEPESHRLVRGSEVVDPPRVAVVRSRVLTRHTGSDVALLYDWLGYLEESEVRVVNRPWSIQRCQNKVWQAAALRSARVPVPPTRLASSLADVEAYLEEWQDVVLKPIYGHASVDLTRVRIGGELAEDGSLLGVREEIAVWHLLDRYGAVCAQRFVENRNRDVRIVVVGPGVVSCHYRLSTAPDGKVKDLLHPYDRQPAPLDDELERIAHAATEALELELATIDLVEGCDGPVVIEVNPTVSLWQPLVGALDLTETGITCAHADLVCTLLDAARPAVMEA